MNELVQAKALRNEAHFLLKQATENLSKTIRFNDQALSNQRRLVSAMSVANFSNDIARNIKHKEIFDIVHAINVLAMTNTDVLHVFIAFMGHTNELAVCAKPVTTVYKKGVEQERLLDEIVYLHEDGALEKLLSIESQLTELIIEAREQAEVNAEVEA
ncbi:hypothetical protein [Vibrio cincinnatiensis]|uniref:hypothetical protein n=1 Tax=Vibrio cincinnatiensis TaxID=675 RepID=UPI001EDFCC77|nr:hypothetical protein [Vibrio cincinnatiensis]MCG3724724.1 hypothetical protein [Vibrio cincinnatiensis]